MARSGPATPSSRSRAVASVPSVPAMPGGASIKDVSRAAGVSISTVSHVLNGTRFVSDELRRRVEVAISELDYRHNGLARSLRTRQSYAIGLVIPDVTNPYYPQIARGVQDAAAEAGYWVFLCNSDRRPDAEVRLLAALEQRRADGIILDAAGPDPTLLAALRRTSVPVVLVGSRIDEPDMDVVTVAPHGGMEAVRYLLSRGHRRIALIAGPPAPPAPIEAPVPSAPRGVSDGAGSPAAPAVRPAKAGGYISALEEADISPDPDLIVQGGYTREGGHAAMRRLLALPHPPTAVFAGNDLMAIGALKAIHDAGLRVPQDVAVVGYDDIPEAATTSPALTTVAVPKYEMGRAAAAVLFERLRARAQSHDFSGHDGPGAIPRALDAPLPSRSPRTPYTPRHIVLPHRLAIRESA